MSEEQIPMGRCDIISRKAEKLDNLIKWLEDKIEELETNDVDDEELKGYLIQRRSDFNEVLNKVKEG